MKATSLAATFLLAKGTNIRSQVMTKLQVKQESGICEAILASLDGLDSEQIATEVQNIMAFTEGDGLTQEEFKNALEMYYSLDNLDDADVQAYFNSLNMNEDTVVDAEEL